ncbi:hypothetical protein Tco_0233304 [Tanacetum coccineum]
MEEIDVEDVCDAWERICVIKYVQIDSPPLETKGIIGCLAVHAATNCGMRNGKKHPYDPFFVAPTIRFSFKVQGELNGKKIRCLELEKKSENNSKKCSVLEVGGFSQEMAGDGVGYLGDLNKTSLQI